MIENLNATIDAKDKEIEQLNEEIKELKAKTYSQQEKLHEIEEENDKLQEQLKENEESTTIPDENDDVEDREKSIEPAMDLPDDEKPEENTEDDKLQTIIDEQLQEINAIKLEKEQIETDRKQLLLWNQELQQKLDDMSNISSDYKHGLTSNEITSIQSGFDTSNVSEKFEHQLAALKQIMSRNLDNIKDQDESKEDPKEAALQSPSSSSGGIEEHKLRAQQTALILYNLEKKLAKLPEMKREQRRDLVDAAVTSIRCLLDNSLTAESELQKQQKLNESRLSSMETAEIELLKAENVKLIRKLEDMKQTWIAHLDMLMSPKNTLFNDMNDGGFVSVNANDIPMAVESPKTKKEEECLLDLDGKKVNLLNQYKNIKLLEIMVIIHQD